MKLSTAIDGYFLHRELDLATTTAETYGYHFRSFSDFLNDPEISVITPDNVRRFLQDIVKRRGLSRRYASDNWISLSSLFNWIEAELGVANPIKVGRIPRPKFTTHVIEPLTEEQIKAVLKCVDSVECKRRNGTVYRQGRPTAKRDRAILLTLLDAGPRASELCALTIADYEQKRGRLHIRHGKGDKARLIFIGKSTQAAVWRYLAEREDTRPNDPLFASDTGSHLDRNNLRRMIQSIAERAGVSTTVHQLRHTSAIMLARSGANARFIQALLGHTTMHMTSRYMSVAEQDLEAMAKAHSPADRMKLK